MATSKDYLSFLEDQLSPLGGITHRMMMGEYLLYFHGKLVAYLCDNRLLIQPTPTAKAMLPEAEYDAISEGGRKKLLRVDQVDDSSFLCALISAIAPELPEPKPKKRKNK